MQVLQNLWPLQILQFYRVKYKRLHERLWLKVMSRRLNKINLTLNFFPESGVQIKSVSIVCYGELSCSACSPSKQTYFCLRIRRYTMTKPGQWNISKYFKFFKRHLSGRKRTYNSFFYRFPFETFFRVT